MADLIPSYLRRGLFSLYLLHITHVEFAKLMYSKLFDDLSLLGAAIKYFWPLIIHFLLIGTSHGDVAVPRRSGLQESISATHLNFFRSALRGRQRVLSCANDPNVCLDREKNPWGGTTCCFQQFCKDTLRDSRNCGACAQACAYGFVCCDGRCVDIQNDPHHCGNCFEECPGQGRCSFAMCDYG